MHNSRSSRGTRPSRRRRRRAHAAAIFAVPGTFTAGMPLIPLLLRACPPTVPRASGAVRRSVAWATRALPGRAPTLSFIAGAGMAMLHAMLHLLLMPAVISLGPCLCMQDMRCGHAATLGCHTQRLARGFDRLAPHSV